LESERDRERQRQRERKGERERERERKGEREKGRHGALWLERPHAVNLDVDKVVRRHDQQVGALPLVRVRVVPGGGGGGGGDTLN
jgi:hypothetical protein